MTESNTRRLAAGGHIDRSRPLEFRFNGRQYSGFKGDTLTSALLAAGVDVLSRSFKYHRARGVQNRGYADVSSLVQLCGKDEAPNILASAQPLFDGLEARSVNCWPSVDFDLGSALRMLSPIIPSGFYYKTFMWPTWHLFEPAIRRAAGFGVAPKEAPDGVYLDRYEHCDVLVVGAGPAGLMAALSAAKFGAKVVLVDEMIEPGGSLRFSRVKFNQSSAMSWVQQAVHELNMNEQVSCLWNATAWGYQEGNMVCVVERNPAGAGVLGRNWKIWANEVVLATGAIERPIVFANNDIPGVMLSSTVSELIHSYAVRPGKRAVLFANNDCAYQVLPHLAGADIEVAAVIDSRQAVGEHLHALAQSAGAKLQPGMLVTKAKRNGNRITALESVARSGGAASEIACDLLCISGGWNPCVHLFSQSRGSLRYDDDIAAFVPHEACQATRSAGAANGVMPLRQCLESGARIGMEAASGTGSECQEADTPELSDDTFIEYQVEAFWSTTDGARPQKAFVDLAGDVTAFDLGLALREGYGEIEHLKRYTTNGMGLDQGKSANVNAIGIVAKQLDCHPSEVGTTTFRPPYTPVEFGSIAGSQCGAAVMPFRHTPMTDWHMQHGAFMFEAGALWQRPAYYPGPGESMDAAIERECHAVRNAIGIYDGSPLGKFVVRGKDALTLINLVYTNSFDTVHPGQGRYGVMLNEEGLIFDDGVSFCLAADEYLLTCSTGGAPAVERKLDKLVNIEHPGLDVVITPVTSQWANATVCGPLARQMLESLDSDIDWSRDALPFMHMQYGTVAGLPARVFRVSFTGELSFEINVPARYGLSLWEQLMAHGAKWNICPVGSEASHVLRVEKGFLSLGHEVDGTVDPIDLGLGWMVSRKKADFVGKRAMEIRRRHHPLRQELVGLLPLDSKVIIPEGAPIASARGAVDSDGFVSACVWSGSCARTVALGILTDGRARMGETVLAWDHTRSIAAEVVKPVFYDPEGKKLRM